jgi:iron complex outermembrane recepter protein
MKKNQQELKNSLNKLMKMALTQFCLSVLITASVFAGSPKAQDILNKSVSVNLENAELRSALAQLEKAAEVQFVYSSKAIQANRKVSISANNRKLSDVLDATLKPLKIGYKVIGGQIMLNADIKKNETAPLSIGDATNRLSIKSSTAQTVTGVVKDEKGEPMPGISVVIKGTTKGTVTDIDGKFSLDAEVGNTLVLTSVGYIKQEITVTKDMTALNIVLKEDLAVLGEVTVVGSRGKARTDVERPVPVDVINAKELQLTGQTELGQMAQFSSPSFNSAKYGINGVANYADPATLRGMSPDQVLLLVNGKRRHQFSALNLNVTLGKGTVTTDMNSIPSLAIERLEILRDGAAAQYGSDAIAGIVNLGLNKAVGKGAFRTQVGQHKAGDGTSYMASINYGFKLGKEGSFLNATLSYNHADGTQRSDPFTGRIYFAAGTTPATTLIREDSMRAAKGVWPTSTSGKPFTVSTYGSNPLTAIQTFVNIGYPLSNGWSLYAFGGTSQKNVAAEGFFRNAIPTDANSNVAKYPNGYDPDLPGVSKDVSGVVGLTRKLDKGWNMDFSTGFGHNSLDLNANNTTNPSMGAASPTEFYVGRSGFGQSTTEANLSKNMDIKGIKSFNFAVGGQYRVDFFKLTHGSLESYLEGPVAGKASGSSGRPGIAPADEVDTKRSNIGLYADVETDITDKFLVAAAVRYENYSDFGNNISGKIATRFKLSNNFSLRGSINKGFRAPSLQQIFNSVTTSTVQAGAIRQTKQLPSSDVRLKSLGIESPKAENSLNYNLGVTAKAGEKFLFTLDAYQIDITDRIIISEAMTTTAVPAVKALFTGTSIQEISFFTNHLSTKTTGIDFVTTFKHSFNENSRFTATLALTANKTEITAVKATPSKLTEGALNPAAILIIDTISRSLIETSQPRQKAILSLGYQWKKLNVTARANHFGEVTAWEKSPVFHRNQTFGAKTIFDLVVTYNVIKNLTVSVGANNLTDVYPDKVLSNYASYFTGQTPYTRNANQFGFNGAFYYLNATLNF